MVSIGQSGLAALSSFRVSLYSSSLIVESESESLASRLKLEDCASRLRFSAGRFTGRAATGGGAMSSAKDVAGHPDG